MGRTRVLEPNSLVHFRPSHFRAASGRFLSRINPFPMLNSPYLRHSLSALLALSVISGATILTGCGDPTIASARAFDARFNALAEAAASANDAFSAEADATSLSALKQLANEVSGLNGATTGQTEAAQTLAASLYRKVASAELARAIRFEQDESTARALAVALANGAASLDGIAASYDDVDLSNTQAGATTLRDRWQQIAQIARASAAAIAAPLGALERQIEAMNASIAQLETESAVLLLKARQAGPATGLPFVEESARLTAEASALKVSMSGMVAQFDAAAPMAQFEALGGETASSVNAAAESEIDQLNHLKGVLSDQSKLARDLANQLRDRAVETTQKIDAERAGPLTDAYAAATETLDKCSGLARGSAGDALQLEVHVERAQLAMSALRGMTEQARLYAVLANSGPLFGGEAKYAASLDALKASATERLTALREQITAGVDATQMLGEDARATATKKWFEDAKKNADALDVEKLFTPPAPVEVAVAAPVKRTPSASSGASASATSGFPTPAALAAAMNAARLDPAADPMRCFTASSAGGKAMLSVMGPMMKEMIPLRKAVAAKFGPEALAALGDIGAGMGMPGVASGGTGDISVGDVSGDTGTLTSGTTSMPIVKTATGWFVDFNATLEASGADLAQMEQMAPMMKAGFAMVMPMLKKAIAAVTAKVESGEITDAAAVGTALQEAMSAGMPGMGGGRRDNDEG